MTKKSTPESTLKCHHSTESSSHILNPINLKFNEVEHHLIRSIALLDMGMTKFKTADLASQDTQFSDKAVTALLAIKEVADYYINSLTDKPK